MSLQGLRAWVGEVERKLGARTRVFLALAAIAIGGAGAAIYLALDTRDAAVSESDVQALQERLETQIDAAGATAETEDADVTQLKAEVEALEAEIEELRRGTDSAAKPKPDETGEAAKGGKARLRELVEKAQSDATKDDAGR